VAIEDGVATAFELGQEFGISHDKCIDAYLGEDPAGVVDRDYLYLAPKFAGFVAGGCRLSYWMRQSGLADLLPSLRAVWVGLSGGSMVMTPSIGADFVSWSRADSDRALGVVDFAIFPHLDHENFPENSMAGAEKWAASMPVLSYAIDDQTAIKVTDGSVEVVSEGHWKLFSR
jgi:hypothetical protein